LRRGCWIGLVNHTSKENKGSGRWTDPFERINRTQASMAGVSGMIALVDPPGHQAIDLEARARILGFRGRDIRDHMLVVEQSDSGAFKSLGKWTAYQQTQTELGIWKAAIELTETTPDSWIPIADIAEATGKKTGATQRSIHRMLKAGRGTFEGWEAKVEKGPGKGLKLRKTGTPDPL
jgi:hypothetical protein